MTIYHQERRSYGSLGPSVIGLKNEEIGADFEYYCTTSGDVANQRLQLDSTRLIGLSIFGNGVLTTVWGYSVLA